MYVIWPHEHDIAFRFEFHLLTGGKPPKASHLNQEGDLVMVNCKGLTPNQANRLEKHPEFTGLVYVGEELPIWWND